MTFATKLALFYFVVISIITLCLTVYDKIASKVFPDKRIPENTLLYLGVLGGAVAEYITMQIIRHKTRHKKFMIGLPVIIVIQAILIFILCYIS